MTPASTMAAIRTRTGSFRFKFFSFLVLLISYGATAAELAVVESTILAATTAAAEAVDNPSTGAGPSSSSSSIRIPNDLVGKYDEARRSINNQTAAATDQERVLNVHIVPHTHDDVGWLKTVEQYFRGLNNTIQNVSVNDILDSVVEALLESPHRTFTYVEVKFFTLWWDQQTSQTQDAVRTLVQNGQLNFANGGWCMHDEAATHFMGMIDQTTLGHSFLKEHLGVVPKVGWQLDPFGHSASQASVMSYKMGFDALYFGRIDYQDLNLRQAMQECEGLWNASNTWDDSTIFWGLTGSYHGNYGRPDGYCFDIHCYPRQCVIDMNRTELLGKAQDFLMALREQSDRTKGNHIMLTFGSDFSYQRAAMNFANMDVLFNSILHFQQLEDLDVASILGPRYNSVNIFYSSPEYYTQCKHNETKMTSVSETRRSSSSSLRSSYLIPRSSQEVGTISEFAEQQTEKLSTEGDVEWTVKQDDFMPYSDCSHCFWTGYFTSRPALKRFERVSSSFLMAARQLDAMLDYTGHVDEFHCDVPLHKLEDASGVVQHHDGVSGTSKQHVAYDYAKRLQGGMDAVAGPCMVRKLKRLLLGPEIASNENYLGDLAYCQMLNETKCEVSTQASMDEDDGGEGDNDMYAVVYNSLGSERSSIIHLPVATSDVFRVEDMETSTANLVSPHPVFLKNDINDQGESKGNQFVLSFEASAIPPMGAKVFRIQKEPFGPSISHDINKEMNEGGILRISNGKIEVLMDPTTGNIHQIGSQKVQNLTTWAYYTSFDASQHAHHDGDHQNSGAYIFRPSFPSQKPHVIHAKSAQVVDTAVGVEVHVEYEESWIQTTTRILKDVPYVELEYQVGPIPPDDGQGKEVVVRYSTMVQNEATFYTDSNGREFIKRKRNNRPTWNLAVYEPVAGNYYPINTAIYMDDGHHSFAIVTDRTQGGGSIVDGTMEIMVHRRTLQDDSRGVSEPINETDVGITPNPPWGNATRLGKGLVIKGTHRILVGEGEEGSSSSNSNNNNNIGEKGGASMARSAMDGAFAEPLVFVASAPSCQKIPFQTTSFSGLSAALPENLMVVTKRRLYEDSGSSSTPTTVSYLVRLGHQYGLLEDAHLSKPIDVDLATLFPRQRVGHVVELTLSGNRELEKWRKERLDWTTTAQDQNEVLLKQSRICRTGNSFTVTLQPMDLRTFKVSVDLSLEIMEVL